MRVKMSKQPPPAPTVSAVGSCPTVIQIVGRPGTGSLPSTIAPPHHPQYKKNGFLSNMFEYWARLNQTSVLYVQPKLADYSSQAFSVFIIFGS